MSIRVQDLNTSAVADVAVENFEATTIDTFRLLAQTALGLPAAVGLRVIVGTGRAAAGHRTLQEAGVLPGSTVWVNHHGVASQGGGGGGGGGGTAPATDLDLGARESVTVHVFRRPSPEEQAGFVYEASFRIPVALDGALPETVAPAAPRALDWS